MLSKFDLLKIEYAKKLMQEIALQQINYKYHLRWIDNLDKSSPENLFSDFKKNRPSSWEIYDTRLSFILLK